MAESKLRFQPLKLDPNLASRKSKDGTPKRNEGIQSDPCPVAAGTFQIRQSRADQMSPYAWTLLYLCFFKQSQSIAIYLSTFYAI